MKFGKIRIATIAVIALLGATLAGCTTKQVADNTGDALGLAGRATVHTVTGAGKLAYRGGKAAVGAVTGGEAE